MTTQLTPTRYTQQIAAAVTNALDEYQLLAKVGLRQPEGLLYMALEPVRLEANVATEILNDSKTLLVFLTKTLSRLKGELALNWVKLVKVSGRLPKQKLPLWQEDLLPFAGGPKIAETLANSTQDSARKDGARRERDGEESDGDVSISIAGNLNAPLVVGNDNQLHSYTYNVEHGGVLNVAAPPTVSPRATPIALKPKPFGNFLDRQTVLPLLKESLTQGQPAEVYAEPGFGKTTLMRYVSHWPELTDSFIDGVVYLPVAKQLAADLLQSLYDIFYEAIPSFQPSYGQIQHSLKEKQALIILNGLSLEKEEMEWLMGALPNCTFLLVSQQRLYWQEGADIALAGLPVTDAIALLQQDLHRSLSPQEQAAAQTLHQSLSGNPLQLRRAAAQIKANNETLDSWLQKVQAQQRKAAAASTGLSASDLEKSSLNRAVFTTAKKQLSPAQKRVLALLGAMGGVALSGEQAQAISKVPEAAATLTELSQLQLIETTETGYRLCADLGEAVSQSFDLRPWLQQATDYFIGASGGTSASGHTEAMVHLLDWSQKTGQWQQSLSLAQHLDHPLAMSGQWQQWQQVLTHQLQAAQQVGNGQAEAWALHQLGTSAIALGNHKQAETWLSRAIALRETLKDVSGAAVSRHNLGLLVPPLIPGQGFVPAKSTAKPHKVNSFVGVGALVGGLIVSGVGLALWLGNQSLDGMINLANKATAETEEAQLEEAQLEDTPLSESNQQQTPLLGVGFDANSLAFGDVLIGRSMRKSVTLTNRRREPLPLPSLSTTAPEEFAIVDHTCKTGTIAPSQSCTITVLFEPRAEGDRTSTLIASRDAEHTTTLPLFGAGINPNTTDSARKLTLEELEKPIDLQSPLENAAATENKPTETSRSGEQAETERVADGQVTDGQVTDGQVTDGQVTDGQADPQTDTPVEAGGATETTEDIAESNASISDAPTSDAPTPADNQPPVVQNVRLQLTQGEPYTFDLLAFSQANDPDPNDLVKIAGIGAIEAGGVLEDNGNGTVTYYPYTGIEPGQFGSYQNNFEFTVVDSQGEKAYGTVFITVTIPEPSLE